MDEDNRDSQEGPRRFRIWVSGRLGQGFAEGIDERIEQEDADGGTTLTGEMVDQSQIHGILDRLRQLGIEVLRFETYRMGAETPSTMEREASGGQPPTETKAEEGRWPAGNE